MTEPGSSPGLIRQGFRLLFDSVGFALFIACAMLAAERSDLVATANWFVIALGLLVSRAIMTYKPLIKRKVALGVALSAMFLQYTFFIGNFVWLIAGPFSTVPFYAVLFTVLFSLLAYIVGLIARPRVG
jgi:hypothetical protein